MTAPPLNVLVIGTGMYVCGRGTSRWGTVLPTLVDMQAHGEIGQILVAGTSPVGIGILHEKLAQLNAFLGTSARVTTFSGEGESDPQAYRRALAVIPRPACAIIAVPDHLHATIAADVIDAGVHPLVVKPLAPTTREVRSLIAQAQECHVYGAVEFHKRFDEANLLLKQTIRDGKLGELLYVTVAFSQRRAIRDIFGDWVAQTNPFQYLGVHYVDLIYFCTGALPRRVMAIGQRQSDHTDAKEVLDAVHAVVEWNLPMQRMPLISTISTNWIDSNRSSAMSDQQITVVGTNGRYHSDQKQRGVQLVTNEHGVEDLNPYFTQYYEGPVGEKEVVGYGPRSIRQYVQDVRAIEEGGVQIDALQQSRPSFRQALISTTIIEAVEESLRKCGQWVDVVECRG